MVAVREVRGKPRNDREEVERAVVDNVVHQRALLRREVVEEDDPRHGHESKPLRASSARARQTECGVAAAAPPRGALVLAAGQRAGAREGAGHEGPRTWMCGISTRRVAASSPLRRGSSGVAALADAIAADVAPHCRASSRDTERGRDS